MFISYGTERRVKSYVTTNYAKKHIPKFLILQWTTVILKSPQFRIALIHIFFSSGPRKRESSLRSVTFKPVLEKLKILSQATEWRVKTDPR